MRTYSGSHGQPVRDDSKSPSDHRSARARRGACRRRPRRVLAQAGARRRSHRDCPAPRRATLCRHRDRRRLCLPDRSDHPPCLRSCDAAAPSARQSDDLRAAAADGGRRLWPGRDGAPFGCRSRLRDAVEGHALDRDRDRGDSLSALGSRPQGQPVLAKRRRDDADDRRRPDDPDRDPRRPLCVGRRGGL